jgi:hypothetical protein
MVILLGESTPLSARRAHHTADERRRQPPFGIRAQISEKNDKIKTASSWYAVRGPVYLGLNECVVILVCDVSNLISKM